MVSSVSSILCSVLSVLIYIQITHIVRNRRRKEADAANTVYVERYPSKLSPAHSMDLKTDKKDDPVVTKNHVVTVEDDENGTFSINQNHKFTAITTMELGRRLSISSSSTSGIPNTSTDDED